MMRREAAEHQKKKKKKKKIETMNPLNKLKSTDGK